MGRGTTPPPRSRRPPVPTPPHELCKSAQVVQAPLAGAPCPGDTRRANGGRVKVQTTVVGDHQGPGDADAVGAFLLVVGRDSYTTYNLPAAGTLTIRRRESNAVPARDP